MVLAKDLLEFREVLRRKEIMFAYCGYVTEAVLGGVGDALKQKLAMQATDTKTVRSVFAVFVEQMQNMIRYSAEKVPPDPAEGEVQRKLRYGVLTIGHEAGGFVVHAGNLVRRDDVERLRARLSAIRAMDRSELKAFYKQQLRAPAEDSSQGAGVGFIEIARRASRPIEFDFMEVDPDFAFFALKAFV